MSGQIWNEKKSNELKLGMEGVFAKMNYQLRPNCANN